MVGHYWLRNPSLAPTPEIRSEIEETVARIKDFAAKIHAGEICGAGGTFKNYLLIGIGGSALGPQFVAHALGNPKTDRLKPFFFDNTDPDGMDRVLATIGSGFESDALHHYFQIRRNKRDAQRNVGRRRCFQARRA